MIIVVTSHHCRTNDTYWNMFGSLTISRPFLLVTILILLCRINKYLSAVEDEDYDSLFQEGSPMVHEYHQQDSLHIRSKDQSHSAKDRVRLSEVKTLIFTRNMRTTSRRTHSIHQLSCVGGTAGCKLFTPDVVECHNEGLDKKTAKPEWRCEADISDRVQFNHVEVICEGYDYPEDDNILMGSCGLEFTLDYVDPLDHHDQSYFRHMDDHEKKMHHERIRARNRQPGLGSSEPNSIYRYWLIAQFASHYSVLIMLLVLVTILALVKSGLYSGPGAMLAMNTAKGKRQSAIDGNCGAASGYGPSTSTVVTTKKAC